ncbi:hypothetical protein [Paenibacillus lentus]|uniref:Lipoprotein n=1 Tax=Paenibacillus lentus TaxID=1338368 RepID=A0A3S8RSH9_9BACL|nr:hypothetical protein [Paenibacillus lentus]AZK45697.1 hypothetical protein EIM92_05330 [Paenibacillus lentus]
MYTCKWCRFSWVLLGAILLLMLAACNGKAGEQNEGAVQNPTQETQEPAQQPAQQPGEQLQEQPEEEEPSTQHSNNEDVTEGQPPTALEAAATVMRALKAGNMDTLANWVDSEGVRFSPYASVNMEEDLVFTSDEVRGLMEDTKKHVWRTMSATGDKIELTYAEYHKRFVYDADFIKNAKIAENKGIALGGEISNLSEVYPPDSYDFVEYHIEGSDPNAEVGDWRSLRLVFKKIGDDRSLVGIIHDQWTP